MQNIINWFDVYKIDHKVSYVDGVASRVDPIHKLDVKKAGNCWRVNGRPVRAAFVKALVGYYS